MLPARADPLGKGTDLVPAIRDKGQILIGLEALAAQVINNAALRLAIIAVDKADIAGLSLFGHGPADDELEVLLSVAPVADVTPIQANDHPALGGRQILPIARVYALGE